MRFMIILKATKDMEAGVLPKPEDFTKMGLFNEQLVKAGVLLSAEGLQRSATGARITFSGGRPTVTDGPFAETKELVGGFWLCQMKSKDEAIEWFSRCPFENGEEIEIRQVHDLEDFADLMTEEHLERVRRLRQEGAARQKEKTA